MSEYGVCPGCGARDWERAPDEAVVSGSAGGVRFKPARIRCRKCGRTYEIREGRPRSAIREASP